MFRLGENNDCIKIGSFADLSGSTTFEHLTQGRKGQSSIPISVFGGDPHALWR